MLLKVIIILTSSLFSLVFFEFFLENSPFENGTSPVEYDSQIGMWHKKSFEGYTVKECYKTKYKFNKEGLPSSIYKHSPAKENVAILGDSYIEGIMVKNENIIHNSLAKEFNNKYNFMNYGLSGSSPVQQFIILKDKINLKNTKYVIQFINLEGDLLDVDSKNLNSLARPKVYVEFDSMDKYKINPPRAKTLYDNIGDFLGDYQIYTFIKKSIYYFKESISIKKEQKTDKEEGKKDLSKNWLYLKGSIYQSNKLIKLMNPAAQYKIVINSNKNNNKLKLGGFLLEEGIQYIYLDDVLKKFKINLGGFSCDSHWNNSAHKDIAKVIKKIQFIN